MKGYKLGREDGKTAAGGYGSIVCAVSMSDKSCSDYVKGYNAGYSSTCGKNPDGCTNILTAISPDPFYTSGWIGGKSAATHDFMTNSSVTTRPNQTMQNCPRTYCQGYWAGYRSGWNNELDGDANGQCFPGMQQLILAKCISGIRIDSKDYGVGYGQASSDFYNPAKGTNNERTTCAVGYHTSSGPINSTNACYAGYYDQMLSPCYYSHTCNKYNPIKPIDYPPKIIPPLPPPPIENTTRLVYDSYYGAGFVQGKDNEIADHHLNYTTPDDRCPYPDPPYVSYCKGYHEGYDFYWRISIHPNQALTKR